MEKAKVYNYQIFLDALNKYTDLKWNYNIDFELFYTDTLHQVYEIVEERIGVFSVEVSIQDSSNGIWDNHLILESSTLADCIDAINSEEI